MQSFMQLMFLFMTMFRISPFFTTRFLKTIHDVELIELWLEL